MPKLTEAHFKARREQILEAAFRCLAQKGYSRMTVRDIAAEAGVSVGTLYLHFENKEAIVQALSEHGRERTSAGLDGIPAEGGSLEILGSVFEYLIGRLDDPDSAAVFRVDIELWAEAIHHPALREMFHASQQHWLDRLSDLIAGAQEAGDFPGGVNPQGLARLLMAMLEGLELQRVMEPGLAMGSLVEPLQALLRIRPDSDFGAAH